MRRVIVGLCMAIAIMLTWTAFVNAGERPAVPDRLVVLTFDDGNKSDLKFVAPLLSRYGFRATFFISEAFQGDKDRYMTWDEVSKLSEAGFEIGNHTRSHRDSRAQSSEDFLADLQAIEERCMEHNISVPITFCYPGYHVGAEAVKVLSDKDYSFARRGCEPVSGFGEYQAGGRGPAYDPRRDHRLLIPSTGTSGPNWSFEDFVWAVDQAKDGKIAVLTFHGVPDPHWWVNTEPSAFESYMKYLHDQNCTVIAVGDLARYVDTSETQDDPFAPIEQQLRLTPVQLTSEYTENPLGIDVARPRFGWKCETCGRGQLQSAYQILVASTEENLRRNCGDLWDSGKVASNQSAHIAYEGKPLASTQKCWWKVRCWNKLNDDIISGLEGAFEKDTMERLREEEAGAFSELATFEMGLLNQVDWKANWVAADKRISAPLLRKKFMLTKTIKRARAYVSGLGYYELYINGNKIGDHVLDPAPTHYHVDQESDLRSRVLYVTYDVTEHLRLGQNAVGAILGNGWYSADNARDDKHEEVYGDRPKVILQVNIEFADGSDLCVFTDDTWKASDSPILANDICHGETYDARLEKPDWTSPEYDDSAWPDAELIQAPSGTLTAQMLPAVRIVKRIPPVRILKQENNVYIYDFGQHFSGWVKLRVRGSRGTTVTLRFAGRLDDNNRLDRGNNRGAAQTDTYTLKGDNCEEWEPRFTLHGFRYVEVTGLPSPPTLESLEGCFVRSAVETSGYFTCSDPLLNQIHHNVCWTLMSSFQGIPQDAADRDERVGWLGDPGFIADGYFLNFNTATFWTKWLNDIKDAQKPSGDIPVVCPVHWDLYPFWPAWKSTYPILVWCMYQYHGDKRVLEEHYDGVKNLVDFLGSRATDYVLSDGLGDHMEPQDDGSSSFNSKHTPVALTSTAYYYYDAWIMGQIAALLGNIKDAERYSRLADNIKNAFNEKFLNKITNQYGTGSQTSNALPLYLGLVPEEKRSSVAKNLFDDITITRQGHLSTGIIGTNALQQALPENGMADVMYQIATQTTFPSWGHQIRNGATTVWETFEVSESLSLNMKMFASTEKFFYRDVAGIDNVVPGWERITVKPRVCADLRHAKAEVDTVRGMVAVDWKKGNKWFQLNVTVPVNATARVSVPKLGLNDVRVTEGGKVFWEAGKPTLRICGINGGHETSDYVTFNVGSGLYDFRLVGTPRDISRD